MLTGTALAGGRLLFAPSKLRDFAAALLLRGGSFIQPNLSA